MPFGKWVTFQLCWMRASVFRDILDSVVLQIRIELHEFLITGCFHSGLHYLSCHSCGGVLNLNAQLAVRSSNGDTEMTTVHRVLLDKHPLGRPPHPSTLLDSPPDPVNPIILDGLKLMQSVQPPYELQVLLVPQV